MNASTGAEVCVCVCVCVSLCLSMCATVCINSSRRHLREGFSPQKPHTKAVVQLACVCVYFFFRGLELFKD